VQKLNFFGGPALTMEAQARLELDQSDHEEDRIVFLANVWLDRAETFEALHTLFSGMRYQRLATALVFTSQARATARQRCSMAVSQQPTLCPLRVQPPANAP
jgi:hypothetical protein